MRDSDAYFNLQRVLNMVITIGSILMILIKPHQNVF